MNSIDAIQQQYIYRVNPINLFEQRGQNDALRSNIFAANNSQFNVNHPVVSGNSGLGNSLDLLA